MLNSCLGLGHHDYRSLSEDERVDLLITELATKTASDSRRRRVVGVGNAKELDIVLAAARAVRVFGPEAVPSYIISMCRTVSGHARGGHPLKEAGLLDVSAAEALPRRHRAVVRDD